MPDERLQRLLAIAASMPEAGRLTIAAERLKQADHLPEAASCLAQLAEVLTTQLGAIEQFDHQFPDSPFGSGPTVDQLLNALLTRADLVETVGDRGAAEAIRDQAMSLATKYQASIDLSDRGRQRAASFLAHARYHEAATALLQARDQFERRNRPVEAGQVALEVGELYEWLGDYPRALDAVHQTRAALGTLIGPTPPTFDDSFAALFAGKFEEAQTTARLAAASSNLIQLEARVLRGLRRFEEADVLLRRIQTEIDPSLRPAADFQLARNDVERGEVARGLALIEQVVPRMTGRLRPRLGAILSWQAEALSQLGRLAEAAPVAAQSVQELRAVADDDSLWKAEWRHARVLAATGRQVASRELYLAAVATVDRLRRAPLGYRLESTFFADKAPLLDDAIRLTAQLDDARTCLQLIERVKSRALTAILTVPTATPDGEETLAAAIDGVSTQLDALEYERYRLGWDPDSHARRERLLADRAGLLERIQLQDPRWRSLTRQAEFDPAETIGSLAATNRAAISLYYRGGIVTAVSIANGGLAVAAHPLSPATIAAIAEYATNLQRDRPIRERYDPAYTAALDAESLIPRTLLEGTVGSGGLVVIPHGELHLLPWGAVTYRGQRLFERLEVTVLPNAACLSLLGRPRGGAGGVALLGAPDQTDLPGLAPLNLAADEILAVEGILGARVFAKETGRSATQARYRSLIGDPRGQGGILHLACHGDFVANAPENSGLLLADGKLDASDIARHRIQFDEVVLSACASGYRPTRVGDLALAADDVIGLPGAFLEAGARSVLVSIPPARDDAALDLMTRYYEFRSDGVPTGRALQQAQIAIQRARTLPAHLWAGFTLYGVGT